MYLPAKRAAVVMRTATKVCHLTELLYAVSRPAMTAMAQNVSIAAAHILACVRSGAVSVRAGSSNAYTFSPRSPTMAHTIAVS